MHHGRADGATANPLRRAESNACFLAQLAVVLDLNELPAALIAAAVGMFYVTGHKPKLSSPVAGAYERNISSQTRNTQQPDGHSPASISATNEASGELGLPLSNSI